MITQKRIHELFEYREDGNLIWKINPAKNVKRGDVAGSLSDTGYLRVRINEKDYRAHRIIFLYHHGYLTDGLSIDHIDGNKTNNCIENLREVTNSQNILNSKMKANNTSGVKGVTWNKEKSIWKAYIKNEGKQLHLGYFHSLEEAEAVVKDARVKYHGEYSRHE